MFFSGLLIFSFMNLSVDSSNLRIVDVWFPEKPTADDVMMTSGAPAVCVLQPPPPPPLISLCYSHRNKREKGQSRDCDDDIIVGTRHTQEKVAPGTPGAEYKKKKQKVKRNLFRAVKFFFSLSKNFSPPVRNWSRHTFSFLYDLSLIIFFLQLCPRFIEKKIFLYLDFQPPAGCCCRILPLRPWFPPLVSPRRDSFLGRVAGSAQKKVSIDGMAKEEEEKKGLFYL